MEQLGVMLAQAERPRAAQPQAGLQELPVARAAVAAQVVAPAVVAPAVVVPAVVVPARAVVRAPAAQTQVGAPQAEMALVVVVQRPRSALNTGRTAVSAPPITGRISRPAKQVSKRTPISKAATNITSMPSRTRPTWIAFTASTRQAKTETAAAEPPVPIDG